MGRWSYQHYDKPCDIVDEATLQPIMCVKANEADMAIDAHNADCAAYEARIAELEAKLTTAYSELSVMTDAAYEMAAVCELHNKRIHEQESELARVRAESLRVVECDSEETSPLEAIFTHGGCVVRDPNGKFYQLSRGATELPDGLSQRTGVFVVRLQRWEDEG